MLKLEQSLITIISNKLKRPTSLDEQIQLLKKRNIIIEDIAYAKDILKRINYYYFTGYMYDFRDSLASVPYRKGIPFNKIYKIIQFDARLRNIFLYCMRFIERDFKTTVAYFFAHNYPEGNISYFFDRDFRDKGAHIKFIEYITKNIKSNSKLPFIQHHNDNYDGYFPIWVAVEVFTLGNLERFYQLLNNKVKKEIAKEYGFSISLISNWLENLRLFRNMLAHDSRLYNTKLHKTPLKAKELNLTTHKIFDYVVVMKLVFRDSGEWNKKILKDMGALFDEFYEFIELKCIGFPNNWKEILTK